MPVVISFLSRLTGQVWLAVLGNIAGSSGQGNVNYALQGLADQLSAAFQMVSTFASVFTNLSDKVKASWQYADPRMKDLAIGAGNLAYAERAAWERLFNQIIPASLARLDGKIHIWAHEWLDPWLQFIQWFYNEQTDWDNKLIHWKDTFVDPWLLNYITFREWFFTYPDEVIETWWAWFNHPEDFGNWGAPPLIGPTIDYYAAPEHVESRDNLTQIIVDATADLPVHVEGAIMAWLTTPFSGPKK